MSKDDSFGDWTTAVIKYLSENTPRAIFSSGTTRMAWADGSMTAFQISCEALVKLGVADAAGAGAIARENPRLPDLLPRWDDICVVVLSLAEHFGDVKRVHPQPESASTLDLNGFHFREKLVPVLEVLGLAKDGSLTMAAETILWRTGLSAGIDITCDPRFAKAVAAACEICPADIRATMDRLVTITEEDIAAKFAKGSAMIEKQRKQASRETYGRYAVENARWDVESNRSSELDWLFFRRWRLNEGWLTASETERALEIFHDSLAIRMRRAVVKQLYDGLILAEYGVKRTANSSV